MDWLSKLASYSNSQNFDCKSCRVVLTLPPSAQILPMDSFAGRA
jgi:hypothetical protein